MNCQDFQDLSPKERIAFIGELVHIVQSDEHCYDLANELIKLGREKGLMENTIIGLEVFDNELNSTTWD